MAYPSSLDSFTDPVGTDYQDSPDHAQMHEDVYSAIEIIESVVGTTGGTNVLKNFSAGKLAVYNSGGTLNAGVLGTCDHIGGTLRSALVGTSQVTGGTVTGALVSAGTVSGALIGTCQVTGGTVISLIGTSQITGGTLANASIGTPTILGGTIVINGTSVPLTFGAAIVPTVGTIADSAAGTLTANAQAYQLVSVTLGTAAGNRTLGTPNNPTAGQALTYRIKNSGSANATLVWASVFRMSADIGTPTIGTGTSWSYYSWRYNLGDTKWDFQGYSRNIV